MPKQQTIIYYSRQFLGGRGLGCVHRYIESGRLDLAQAYLLGVVDRLLQEAEIDKDEHACILEDIGVSCEYADD